MLTMSRPPDKFLVLDDNSYPSHQQSPMIEARAVNYFLDNRERINSDLVFMPIQWTAYHRAHHYGQYIADLQYYIEGIVENNPTTNFFTIVQYADGILAKFPNCKIFAAGGYGKCGHSPPRWEDREPNHDIVPIPLICDSHPVKELDNPRFHVSYMGNSTHPIREKMIEELEDLDNYYLTGDPGSTSRFRDVINDSIFILCPRGTGLTSFRLYETIQMQRIPVYISDELFLPFMDKINWEKLALLVKPDEICKIPSLVDNLISSGEYLDKIEYGKEVYSRYFTWDGCLAEIECIISKKEEE